MKESRTYSIDNEVYQSFDELTTKMNINKSSFIEDKIINFVKENQSLLHDEKEKMIIKKWKPITDRLNITNEEHRKKLCIYAEHSMELANLRMTYEPTATLYVPMELKILSKLDPNGFDTTKLPAAIINGKAKQVIDYMNNFSTKYMFPVPGISFIFSYEDVIIDKMIEFFENMLQQTSKIYFYSVINNIIISTNEEDGNITDIRVFSRLMTE